MLAADEPMQAKAEKMTTADNNLQIHYEGNAVAWQGGNRVEAERIDFDRDRLGSDPDFGAGLAGGGTGAGRR